MGPAKAGGPQRSYILFLMHLKMSVDMQKKNEPIRNRKPNLPAVFALFLICPAASIEGTFSKMDCVGPDRPYSQSNEKCVLVIKSFYTIIQVSCKTISISSVSTLCQLSFDE